ALICFPKTAVRSVMRPLVLASMVARSLARTVPTTSSTRGAFLPCTAWVRTSIAGKIEAEAGWRWSVLPQPDTSIATNESTAHPGHVGGIGRKVQNCGYQGEFALI